MKRPFSKEEIQRERFFDCVLGGAGRRKLFGGFASGTKRRVAYIIGRERAGNDSCSVGGFASARKKELHISGRGESGER